MKSSENSRGDLSEALTQLRAFGVTRFGSLKEFAKNLGITPQNLNGYLSGERRPGRVFLTRLAESGFDVSKLLDTRIDVSGGVQAESLHDDLPPLAFGAAFTLLSLPAEAIADQVEASPKQVQSWIDKKAVPSHRQLALLFNLVAFAGVAARCGGHVAAVSHPASPDQPEQAAA